MQLPVTLHGPHCRHPVHLLRETAREAPIPVHFFPRHWGVECDITCTFLFSVFVFVCCCCSCDELLKGLKAIQRLISCTFDLLVHFFSLWTPTSCKLSHIYHWMMQRSPKREQRALWASLCLDSNMADTWHPVGHESANNGWHWIPREPEGAVMESVL